MLVGRRDSWFVRAAHRTRKWQAELGFDQKERSDQKYWAGLLQADRINSSAAAAALQKERFQPVAQVDRTAKFLAPLELPPDFQRLVLR